MPIDVSAPAIGGRPRTPLTIGAAQNESLLITSPPARVKRALSTVGLTVSLMNLTAPLPAMAPFDVIFLRNVLIYFDVATKKSVLRNVARLVRPDGWLFLGAAETTIGIDDNYERVAAGRTSAYRIRNAAPVGAARKG